MRKLRFLIVLLFCGMAGAQTTWYVRGNGGTLYHSTRNPSGRCNGKSNLPDPGSGTNVPCAAKAWDYLWNPGGEYRTTNFLTGDWVIAAGDTVIADAGSQYRVGWRNGSDGNDATTGRRWGVAGNAFTSWMPAPPSGTSGAHTRLLGSNYASCSVGGKPDKTKLTQVYGGFGLDFVMSMYGASYVDVQCIELTRHSQCIRDGDPNNHILPFCSSSIPVDDYAKDGVETNTGTHDVLLQDMWIHGFPERGIKGAIGGLITTMRVDIDTNGMAGWDFDDGSNSNCVGDYCQGTASINGVVRMNYSEIEWSGCNQQYPAIDPKPVVECFGQSNGGYGDGLGTPANNGMDFYIDHSSMHHSVQDGFDLLHIDKGSHTLSITNSISYFNQGQQFKWGGGFLNATFVNNIAASGCNRMSAFIQGVPSTYYHALGDSCRAFDLLTFNLFDGGTNLVAFNTFVGYNNTMLDVGCSTSSCSSAVLTYKNNAMLMYPWTGSPSQTHPPNPLYLNGPNTASGAQIGTFNRSYNLYYGGYYNAANTPVGIGATETATNELGVDPKFVSEPASMVSEATLEAFNFAPASGSPLLAAGNAISGITTDYTGATRASSPSIGALEPGSAAALPIYPASPPQAPTIVTQPTGVTVVNGNTVTLTTAANGLPTPTVQWFQSGASIPGATGATYTTPALSTGFSAPFYAVWTNSQGSATTNTVTVAAMASAAPFSYSFASSGLDSNVSQSSGTFPYAAGGVSSSGSGPTLAVYTGGVFNNDQYSQVTVGGVGSQGTPSPCIRNGGYTTYANASGQQMYSRSGPLGSAMPAMVAGHAYALYGVGSTISYKDMTTGTVLGTATDTSASSGTPCLSSYQGTTSSYITAWSGGSGLPGAGPAPAGISPRAVGNLKPSGNLLWQ